MQFQAQWRLPQNLSDLQYSCHLQATLLAS